MPALTSMCRHQMTTGLRRRLSIRDKGDIDHSSPAYKDKLTKDDKSTDEETDLEEESNEKSDAEPQFTGRRYHSGF